MDKLLDQFQGIMETVEGQLQSSQNNGDHIFMANIISMMNGLPESLKDTLKAKEFNALMKLRQINLHRN